MHIIHLIFNTDLKNAYLQYTEALKKITTNITAIHNPKINLDNFSDINRLPIAFKLSLIRYIRKLIKDNKHTIIVTHDYKSLAFARLAALGLNNKLLIIGVRHALFKSKLTALLWSLKSDLTITNNKDIIDTITKLGYDSYHIQNISHGLKLQPNTLPNSIINIGFYGKLEKSPGIETLIKAIGDLIHKKNFPCKLYIVGQGSFNKGIRKQIIMHDIVEHVCIENINKADLFTKIRCLCIPVGGDDDIIIDAMSAKIPIIASDEYNSVITNNVNGLLFNQHDHDELSDTIKNLFNDEQRLVKIIDVAFQEWQEHHSIDCLVKELQRIFTTNM